MQRGGLILCPSDELGSSGSLDSLLRDGMGTLKYLGLSGLSVAQLCQEWSLEVGEIDP